ARQPAPRAAFLPAAPPLGNQLDQREPPAADLVEWRVPRGVLEADARIAHLHAHAAGVEGGGLPLRDAILARAAVAAGVVHQLAGDQEQRALQLGREPRRRALDPGA